MLFAAPKVLLYIVVNKITTNTPSQATKLTLLLEIMYCADYMIHYIQISQLSASR